MVFVFQPVHTELDSFRDEMERMKTDTELAKSSIKQLQPETSVLLAKGPSSLPNTNHVCSASESPSPRQSDLSDAELMKVRSPPLVPDSSQFNV